MRCSTSRRMRRVCPGTRGPEIPLFWASASAWAAAEACVATTTVVLLLEEGPAPAAVIAAVVVVVVVGPEPRRPSARICSSCRASSSGEGEVSRPFLSFL